MGKDKKLLEVIKVGENTFLVKVDYQAENIDYIKKALKEQFDKISEEIDKNNLLYKKK